MIRGLIDATSTFSIGLRFSFMNILHVESDSLAQLKEGSSHAGGDVVDNVTAN